MPQKKYGLPWDDSLDDLGIEMRIIQNGGHMKHMGTTYGYGLSYHYEQMRKIIWPHLDTHRWHELCRDEVFRPGATVTVLMGPGSSGKTHEAAWAYLCEYWCFPEETCVLVSSTDQRGLRLRVWGEIAMLWESGVNKFPRLAGNLIDSKMAITSDNVDENDFDERSARDFRKGIIGIPTVSGGKFVGLGKWVGIKQKRVRLIADEASMMGASFLSAFANLNKNVSFQAIVLGNPNDPLDPLGKAAEPRDGWTEEYMEPTKTRVWDTRFMNGRCVNLIGLDSPNMDFLQDQPSKYPYLISAKKIAETLSFFSKDSLEYYSQCVGSMKIGTLNRRVLTRDMCRKFKAQEAVVWKGDATTKVYFVDASYGGDRCVGGMGEFGLDINGDMILAFSEPKIIPIKVGIGVEPEYQIAEFVKSDCEALDIPPDNMGHDATGRGSLGTAIAQVWSSQTNPVESGGKPTERPVSADHFITDPETRQNRPKLCTEHYDRRVSEYWYSVRYAVEASQIRDLPEEPMDELCTRKWDLVKNKIVVEPKDGTATRPGMKQRTGKSPDMGDWAAGIVEMARRRGFVIKKLANSSKTISRSPSPLELHAKSYRELIKSKELQNF